MGRLTIRWIFSFILALGCCIIPFHPTGPFPSPATGDPLAGKNRNGEDILILPAPQKKGSVSVEEAIASRRTRRNFSEKPLPLESLSQILWAAQGITGGNGTLRSAPSAGALYPLDVYVVVGKASVQGLEAGIFHYLPHPHGLRRIAPNDLRNTVARACLYQMWMARAPVDLVLTAEYERIEKKYGSHGKPYALMEAGHACQNIFLQAEALGLAAGIVGAFDDDKLAGALHLPPSHRPLMVMPVGYP